MTSLSSSIEFESIVVVDEFDIRRFVDFDSDGFISANSSLILSIKKPL